MKKRRNQIIPLCNLYLGNTLNRLNMIIIILGSIILAVAIYFISDPWILNDVYITSPVSYHYAYISQATLVIELFNIVVLTALIINLCSQSSGMDLMFVSYIKRRTICICKVLVIGIIGLFLILIEMFIVYLIMFLKFYKFEFNYLTFINFLSLYLLFLFQTLLGLAISSIHSSIFIPIGYLFSQIIYLVVFTNNEIVMDKIGYILPWISIDDKAIIYMKNPLTTGVWIISLIFLYINIYNIKDIKN